MDEQKQTAEGVLDELIPCGEEAGDPPPTVEGTLDATPPGSDMEAFEQTVRHVENNPPFSEDGEIDDIPFLEVEEPPGCDDDEVPQPVPTAEDEMITRVEARCNEAMNDDIDVAVAAFRSEVEGKVNEAKQKIDTALIGATGKVEAAVKAVQKEGADKIGGLVGDGRKQLSELRKETELVKETHNKYRSHIEMAGNKLVGVDKRIEEWDTRSRKLEKIGEEFVKAGVLPEQFLEEVHGLRDDHRRIREEHEKLKVLNRRAFDDIWEALREMKKQLPAKSAEQPATSEQPPAPEPKGEKLTAVLCTMCTKLPGIERDINGEKLVMCDACHDALSDEAKPKEERLAKPPKPAKKTTGKTTRSPAKSRSKAKR